MNELQSTNVNTSKTNTSINSLEANAAFNRQNSKQKEIFSSEYQHGIHCSGNGNSFQAGMSQSTTDQCLCLLEKGARWVAEHPVETVFLVAGVTAPFIFDDCFKAYHNSTRKNSKKN